MKAAEWAAAGLGLAGYLLVMAWPGQWQTLLPWAVSNPTLAWLSWRAGMKGQAALWAAYFVGTLWGLWRW